VTQAFSNPHYEPPQTRPVRLATVLAASAKHVFIITGNFGINIPQDNVTVMNVRAPMIQSSSQNWFPRIFRFVSTQFALSSALIRLSLKLSTNLDAVFFFGGEASPMPVLISKLLRRKTILVLRGSLEKETQMQKNIFSKLLSCLKRVAIVLSDKIIVYSKNIVSQWSLGGYQNKILIAPYLFLDFNKFGVERSLNERGSVVGYIGRLSPEKGIWNLIEAIPKLVEASPDVRFLIVGDGELRREVEQYLTENNLENKVRFAGWVSNDDIPDYLNQLKLLVLPSYTEGLPVIVQEAMACGTPVLATPVGAIPDIITDGENGFIMESNSPECIARNVTRALNSPDLEKIARNARVLVEKEFTYQAAVERYRAILASLNLKQSRIHDSKQ
jgi:glycosyltransferase involved in cell wall biosynthesis